ALDDTQTFSFYAVRNPADGQSTLNRFDPSAGAFRSVLDLGTGFTGGLAYDQFDGTFYAIADDGTGPTLFQIALGTRTVTPTTSLASVTTGTFAGLMFDPFDGNLYATAIDRDGISTLYRISPTGGFAVASLFTLGTGFTGGLAPVVVLPLHALPPRALL